jgi:hypothetical protein
MHFFSVVIRLGCALPDLRYNLAIVKAAGKCHALCCAYWSYFHPVRATRSC